MTSRPAPLPAPDRRAPFVLGIAGKMQPSPGDPARSEAIAAGIRARVFAVLDWLRFESPPAGPTGSFDLPTGTFRAEVACDEEQVLCRPCGLRNTPIVVLSSLAPGADSIAAEAALDYRRDHPDALVTVRAPLPFPVEAYVRATTFRAPEETGEEPNEKQRRFLALVDRIREQPGFVEERDLFCVRLHEALERQGSAEGDLKDEVGGKARRKLRYRAAGEYVAATSHLLFAVVEEETSTPTDDEMADPFSVNTGIVVEAKRRGPSHGLLALADAWAWADSGPVLLAPFRAEGGEAHAPMLPMRMVHPHDTRPQRAVARSRGQRVRDRLFLSRARGRQIDDSLAEVPDTDPDWQRQGAGHFRRMLRLQEEFNSLPASDIEEDEIEKRLEPVDADLALRPDEYRVELGEEARAFAERLRSLAAVRRRAGDLAGGREKLRSRVLRLLAWLVLVAALSLGAYEHWIPKGDPDHVHGLGTAARLLLGIVMACLLVTSCCFWLYHRSGAERKRYDWRAIGEGLRVQLYWCLAGIPASAASEYMQRQRGELSWIRRVLSAVTMPTERWRAGFDGLGHEARAELLHVVRVAWVRDQLAYARKRAGENEGRLHRWHHAGWSLAAAGVLNVVGKFVGALGAGAHHFLGHHPWSIGLTVLGVGLSLLLIEADDAQQGSERAHGDDDLTATFAGWLGARRVRWGHALAIGALVFGLAHFLGRGSFESLPGWHAWWMILTGAVLVGGALCLAWSERNFHGEHARAYSALETLYDGADRRLRRLIERFRVADPASPEAAHTLEEIRSLLYEVGCDALDENADWLILHRTRPLEPFMAG